MRLQISFPIKTFEHTGAAFAFVQKHLSCRMMSIFSNKAFPSNDWITNDAEVERSLAEENDNRFTMHDGTEPDAYMYDKQVNMVSFLRDPNYQIEIITFDVKEEALADLVSLMIAADTLKFTIAQRFDYEKARWQSEQVISNFEIFQIKHDHRPKIVHPIWGKSTGLTIDISNNPGRDILTFGMRLYAAPEMWFGPGAWQFFHPDGILNCASIEKTNRITDGLLYVKLFDPDVEDYEDEYILNTQRQFRSCSKMDDVEQMLNNKLAFKPYY